MKKKTYIVVCLLFLLILAMNVGNDKYKRTFLNDSMNITKEAKIQRYSATIHGNGKNSCTFAKGPNVYLNKGEYRVIIYYRTDTNNNDITINSKIEGKDVSLSEEEGCLSYDKTSKVLSISSKEDISNFNFNIEFGGNGTFILDRVVIESVNRVSNDTFLIMAVFAVIFIILGNLLYGKKVWNRKEKIEVFFAILLITICSSYTFFSNGIIKGHDLPYHLDRIEGIKSGLLAGQFPVRIHTDIFGGYGYPSSLFYPELFLYIPAVLRILNISLVTAVQLFGILINFTTALTMYLAASKMSKSRYIGIIASAFYVLSIYHLCDMYTRFALGEVIAMAFLPLVIYGIYELIYADYSHWKYAVVGMTGLLQSHILSVLLTIPLLIVVSLFCIKKLLDRKRIFACIKAAFTCLLLNLWFVVPFLQLMKEDINLDKMKLNVAENALYISQLFETFTPPRGTRNVIGAETGATMSLHLGIGIIVAVVFAIYVIVNNYIEVKEEKKGLAAMILLGAITAYGSTYLFPWSYLQDSPVIGNVISMIQFPWRYLAFSTAFFSIAGAFGIYYLFKSVASRKIMIIIAFVISLIPAAMYLDDFNGGEIILYRGEGYTNTEVAGGEYLYTGTNSKLYQVRGDLVETSGKNLIVKEYKKKSGKIYLDIINSNSVSGYIEVPLLYYPVYTATLNQETKLAVENGTNNVLRVVIPESTQGNLVIKYRGRKLWDLCTGISIISLVLLLLETQISLFLFKKVKKF